ncbi:hypothetical protein C7380_12318 [Oceanotoga teriensis]|jgi:hypothetical protein|uniref:Phosphoesterase n=1 Tax=Oceanotoga teriensis TaxID=515440 RepID=A0AA45C4X1_9BACT|nr:phosphodiesterase [Oceanotoga teriensis]PWJ87537.1 hypothetical protein C7380_12318 [Oceanotoga teriensis]
MKIGVISDIHGSAFYLEKALNSIGDVDKYFILGDFLYHGARNDLPYKYEPKVCIEILNKLNYNYVTGNCDSQIDHYVLNLPEPKYMSFESYGKFNLMLTHGWTPTIEEAIKISNERNMDILIHGHTHISKIEKKENILIFNPGSVSIPKEQTPKSCGILEIFDNKIKLNLIDIENNNYYDSFELKK